MPFPEKLYVTANQADADPEETVWTLSADPREDGWNTDGGYGGYGLTRALADEIARRYNLGG